MFHFDSSTASCNLQVEAELIGNSQIRFMVSKTFPGRHGTWLVTPYEQAMYDWQFLGA